MQNACLIQSLIQNHISYMSVAQNSYFQELVAAVQTVFHVLMWALRDACLKMQGSSQPPQDPGPPL